jgi:mRNA interferase RelE/StbE
MPRGEVKRLVLDREPESGYHLARMKYRVVFAPEAREDYDALPGHLRSEVRDAINRHLLLQPTRVSRSRIRRLHGTLTPQYRLRVGNVRVFYDVRREAVEVLGIVEKRSASDWLERRGVYDEESGTGRS